MQSPSDSFDIIVIGAGINGLGIARDAARRGLRVVVLEKDDICSGVSAWSGRLAHGGLRYLEHRDFALVRESLRERERMIQLAPHLVKPLRLLMPFYAHNRRPTWLIRLGMIIYDVLSFDKKTGGHEILNTEATRRRFPGMAAQGLGGAAVFTEGQVEYAERLCVELAVAAAADGASIVTKACVEEPVIDAGRLVGVKYRDLATGEVHDVRAPLVLNVAGPWIDRIFRCGAPAQPRLNGGTKGSHLIVDPFPGAPKDVIYYESKTDGRLVLVIPWAGRYMIGTTDLRFDDDPDGARCSAAEMNYLLAEVNLLIPEAGLKPNDVLYTFSGVRPLPYAPDVVEAKIPRSHVLHDHAPSLPGLVTIVGGKLTTFRQLAEDAVDDAIRRLGRTAKPCTTASLPFPGAAFDAVALRGQLAGSGFSPRSIDRLIALYGGRAGDIVSEAQGDAALLKVVHEPSGAIGAELVFAVRKEFAVSLADVLARRMLLAFEAGHALAEVDDMAALLGHRLGWDAQRRAAEVAGYKAWLSHLAVPAQDDAQEAAQ
ncbi:MAG: glycerol-3-phosphate dehydrogenase/oxidase [Alphaproteobacteria bacterium]|nr:glycerol-3-phosphate dehydrogenase/oxidase [Alphaproteobacteria bacterium]